MTDQIDHAIVITGSGSGVGAATARVSRPGAGILVRTGETHYRRGRGANRAGSGGAATVGLCRNLARQDAAQRDRRGAPGNSAEVDSLIHVAGYPVQRLQDRRGQGRRLLQAIPLAFYRLV